MIRRPPRSTLFPTRRSSDLVTVAIFSGWLGRVFVRAGANQRSQYRFEEPHFGHTYEAELPSRHPASTRSEEHTSELQSRLHLVCRLLLEKKKNTTSL